MNKRKFSRSKKTRIGWSFGSPEYNQLSREAKIGMHILEARRLLTGQCDFTEDDLRKWFEILSGE